ncbi:DUF3052 domain-containing protein [bacterium SCSIO 12741]|nr:DUF3052 domain-containing protein [bacterium SCSIO 12741]
MPGTTPLYRKLGIKPNMVLQLLNAPKEYWLFFEDVPEGIAQEDEDAPGLFEMVHLFCQTEAELLQWGKVGMDRITKHGMLWVSWPKKTSTLFQGLNPNQVRGHLRGLGLIDVKVCALTEDWTAVKFMYRKENR